VERGNRPDEIHDRHVVPMAAEQVDDDDRGGASAATTSEMMASLCTRRMLQSPCPHVIFVQCGTLSMMLRGFSRKRK
jgi:hypothetical protein